MNRRRLRTYHEVADTDSENIVAQITEQRDRLAERLSKVGHIVAVGSGKGGVGKSAIAANLAALLAHRGRAVGAADADLDGPSLARMLGAEREPLRVGLEGVEPVAGVAGVRVMSMDLLLASDEAPVHWRRQGLAASIAQSALETGVVREFLADVAWGDLDVLLIDVPPGTARIVRLLELIPDLDTLLIVTTPSHIARFVVNKSIQAAREAGVARLGVVSNMTAYTCPTCGTHEDVFGSDRRGMGRDEAGVGIWGEIPFDPRMGTTTDRGKPFVMEAPEAQASRAIEELADRIEDR